MIALRIDFLAGQFHANPWDRGTNEGEIEWPPSPWRLLRAIVAGWHRSGGQDREMLLSVLDALAEPPIFDLPAASSGHTRHYVPLGGLKSGKPERTLMLDSFLALERGREHGTRAFAIWQNVSLDRAVRELLERCCGLIGYLGRAESWCEITVVTDIVSGPGRYRVDLASRGAPDGPVVRRLAASPSLRGLGLLRALSEMTGEMRRARRTMPQGTTWVDYRLPADFGLIPEQALLRDKEQISFPPTVLRFVLDAESGVLPPLTKTIVVAEKMRQAVIKQYSNLTGNPASQRLAGKHADGSARREAHDHPFFLPLDLAGNGFIDALDVWLPAGCTHAEFRAITVVSRIWDDTVLNGAFAVTYLGRVETPTSSRWSTITPLVLDRFPKRRGPNGSVVVDGPKEQIGRALERRGLGSALIELWDSRETIRRRVGSGMRLDAFRRCRLGERPVYPSVGATITFDRAIEGPLVLGRLAHFGLGQFQPCDA